MAKSIVESLSKAVVDLTVKTPIRVLHVDDEADFLKVAKGCLEMQGAFEVDTAPSVEEAMEKMKKKEFDVIVSDYVMPGKDGLQFLKELRGKGNNISFIIFTGKGSEEVAIEALNYGADQYLNKAGDPEVVYGELAYSIRQAVKTRQAERALQKAHEELERRVKERTTELVKLNEQMKREISELKKTEEELKGSEERLKILFEFAPDGVYLNDLKGNFIDGNRAAEKITGYKREELIGKSFLKLKLLPRSQIPKAAKLLAKNALGKPTGPDEFVLNRNDGTQVSLEIRTFPVKIKDRTLVLGIARDITERKRAEDRLRKAYKELEKLVQERTAELSKSNALLEQEISDRKKVEKAIRESQEKFKGLFMDNPEATVYVDPDFHISDVNLRFTELFEYSLDEVKGKHIDDVMVPKDKMEEAKILAKRFMKENVYYDTVRKRKNGSLVPVSISAAPITVEGQPLGYVGLYKDITERKRFEERLSALNIYSRDLNMTRSMEEIYRLTLDAMEKTLGFEHAFFMVVDKDMLCVVDQRGYPVDLSTRLPLDGSKRGVSVKVARTGKPINVPDAEKEDAWVEFWPGIRSGLDVPVKIGRKVLGVIGVDSKSLSAFDEKDQKLLEILASHAATAISNLEHAKNLEVYAREIRESKEKFERLFMNNPEAAVCTDSNFRILDVNPRFSELFGYSLDEVKGKHINDVIVPEDKMEEAETFDKRASNGEAYEEDTVRKRKDGILVPVSFSAAPIIVEKKAIGHVAMYKDISQLKKAEKTLRDTLEKLETVNEKLRVVGRLTRHDVRNKLCGVTGNVYLAKKKLPDDHKAMEQLVGIASAVRQAEKIFDFARTYERLGVEELAYMDVEKDVEGAVALFSDLHGVKVVNDCRGLTVLADSMLRQFFYNLVDNSLKHGGKVSQIRVHYEEEAGKDQLKLVYEDDGVGISRAEKEKIFKEGYGKGTGYGLFLIKKICEVYGWTVKETGKQGKGAQFTMTIRRKNESGKIAHQLH